LPILVLRRDGYTSALTVYSYTLRPTDTFGVYRARFDPPLRDEKQSAIEKIQMSDAVKILLSFDEMVRVVFPIEHVPPVAIY